MIKAAFFDLDGTLLDTTDVYWRSFNAGVTACNLPPITRDQLMAFMDRGVLLPTIMAELYPQCQSNPAIVDTIMAAVRKGYPAGNGYQVKLVAGALELLQQVKQHQVKIAVVTSRTTPAEKVSVELTRMQIAPFFDAVVTSTGLPRKPAPDVVLKSIQIMNIPATECIMIGDSRVDIAAAKAAGVKTVAVATGVAYLNSLQAESPDMAFDSLITLTQNLDIVLAL